MRLLAHIFDICSTMLHKNVFEASLAGFGAAFGSSLVALEPFWFLFGSILASKTFNRERERERVRERGIYFATISDYTLVFAPWHLWRAAEGRLDAAVLSQVATTRIHALRL